MLLPTPSVVPPGRRVGGFLPGLDFTELPNYLFYRKLYEGCSFSNNPFLSEKDILDKFRSGFRAFVFKCDI